MFMRRPARVIRAAVLTAAIAAVTLTATPAMAATAAPAKPGDICWPTTWYTVTSVITRSGIVQLLPTVVEPNNSTEPSTLTMGVSVSGSVTAGVTGSIPVAPQGIAASIGPNVSANVSGSVSISATTTVPPGYTGYLQFGIITEQTNGIAYSRDFWCNVTSQPEVATAPEGFGYIASSAPTNPSSDAAVERHPAVITRR